MATTFLCPNPTCRSLVISPATFDTVRFEDNATNVSVQCRRCGTRFEGAPGGNGTFSTVAGRLRRVARYVADADANELQELRERLLDLEQQRDDEQAAALVTKIGVQNPRGGWLSSQKNRMELYAIIGILLAVLAAVIALKPDHGVTEDEIEKIISEQQKKAPAPGVNRPAPTTDATPGVPPAPHT